MVTVCECGRRKPVKKARCAACNAARKAFDKNKVARLLQFVDGGTNPRRYDVSCVPLGFLIAHTPDRAA
jgi:hypothetical protein